MKKKIVCLVTVLAMFLFCMSAFAQKTSLQDFESITETDLVYTDSNTQNWQNCFFLAPLSENVSTGLETGSPLSGNSSIYIRFATGQWQWGGLNYLKIGGSDWTGADYLGFRVKNNNPNALVRLYLTVCADGTNWTAPSFSSGIKMIDLNNEPVEYTIDVDAGARIPAGFDGTVFLPLHFTDTSNPAPSTVQYSNVSVINFALTLDVAAETEKILFDDFALYLENDIPTPAPSNTPTDTSTETPTQTPTSTATEDTDTTEPTSTPSDESPSTGDPMLIGSAIALCISAAAIVIRKKH